MAVVDEERIVRRRVRVPPGGEQDDGAEIRRSSPELRQPVALEADVPDLFRVLGGWIGGMT